ncbi:MAG TPA: AAA family ATPase [Caproicibacter sp.]|nr:AAA family ATPase [Caproicibacter sp.]
MIKSVTVKNFKNYKNLQIDLHSITTLIGMNASGKSNFKEAFKLLHGIARGYSLAEVIGEKWGDGGFLQWKGIRGGTKEMINKYANTDRCSLSVKFSYIKTTINKNPKKSINGEYTIEIAIDKTKNYTPKITKEVLIIDGCGSYVYNTHPHTEELGSNSDSITCRCRTKMGQGKNSDIAFRNDTPILTQFLNRDDINESIKKFVTPFVSLLLHMRFFDLSPDAMRQPSFPGVVTLSDKGENLSSVIKYICEKSNEKQALLDWISELTPQDVMDFNFATDNLGKVIVDLIDKNGKSLSAYSASDGTLRFLGIVSALFSSDETMLYFFEEIENGIHPSRIKLLVELFEERCNQRGLQIILSSHSPLLLGYLNEEAKKNAYLIYYDDIEKSSNAKSILKLPQINNVLQNIDYAELFASGWFEDSIEFMKTQSEDSNE